MSTKRRLEALETRMAMVETACPRCGANWAGSVFVEVHPDGRAVPRCWKCGTVRPMPPDGGSKTLAAGLWEALQ